LNKTIEIIVTPDGALGQLTRSGHSLISFRNLAPKLTELFKEFCQTRKSYHPEYPFWRLQEDGVWVFILAATVILVFTMRSESK
tara:strand:- start:5670 stop:5921 length:252 start_codon:yes stop_codon:yes gene_type:complete